MLKKDLRRLVACAVLGAIPMTIATAQAPAAPVAPAPLPVIAPSLVPAHLVDLMTAQGMAAFRAQWKTMEAKIVEGPALPNAMPGYKTSYDINPHAGESGFDDSSWPTIDPKGLADRRGGGKVSFLWFRTNLTGDKFQIAIFGINGPISIVPANFVFFREAKIEFYK